MTSTQFPRIPESEIKVGDILHSFGTPHVITHFAEQSPAAVFPGRLAKDANGWGIALLEGDWISRVKTNGLWVEQVG